MNLEHLDGTHENKGHPEILVDLGEHSLEDVHLGLTDLPAVEVVEQLHEDECAVDVGEKFLFHLTTPPCFAECPVGFISLSSLECSHCINIETIWTSSWLLGSHLISIPSETLKASNVGTEDEKNKDQDEVPEGDTQDLSPDSSSHNLNLGSWWISQDLLHWWFSRQGDGSESVHDQVDPKELDGVEWRLSDEEPTDEDGQECRNVHSYLELEETGDVVEDVSSPLDGLYGSFEVIFDQNEVSTIDGSTAA